MWNENVPSINRSIPGKFAVSAAKKTVRKVADASFSAAVQVSSVMYVSTCLNRLCLVAGLGEGVSSSLGVGRT